MNSTLSGGQQNTIYFCLLELTGVGTVVFRNHTHRKDLKSLGMDLSDLGERKILM
jgi:hypothetical protein